ncbi:MAG: arsenate reductase ArsC [Methyloversatilis discipulorum]|jgi:protein-tyrosine-phosphatase|uniref:arsenate reductase ArsC n=1 Tax=Methyloversatilis discipulorum TaxID=1119528 RepID=UPI0026ED4B75|nr:arsenate reductase ArsC [Methyloversatilis discipulorum]MBV5284821.1 arsenate reductase ArsC [Methyloversatilis discipulorum]
MARPLNVLFLCTHNSARSVLAECLLNHLGGTRFRAFSAGSQPSGRVNPFALQALAEQGIDTTGVRSKAWDEFAAPGAPTMDLIITVCDSAAGETCPVWPGHPATAHWGYADPSATPGSDAAKLTAFRDTLALIRRRLEILVAMPDERLHALALQQTARDLAAH